MISTICVHSTRQLNLALPSSNLDGGRVNGPHSCHRHYGCQTTTDDRFASLVFIHTSHRRRVKKSRQYLPALYGRTYTFLLELDDTCSVGIHPTVP